MDNVTDENRVDPNTLELLRGRLNKELASAADAIDSSKATMASFIASRRGVEVDDEHDPEGSTLALHYSETSALLNNSRHHLDQAMAALGRIADGSYGICELCSQPIALARLEARPSASHCVRCAEVAGL